MKTSNKGTGAQMEQAFMNQINKLSGGVESCDNISSAVDPQSKSYLNSIIKKVISGIQNELPDSTVSYEINDDDIKISVTTVDEFNVPFDDLSFSTDAEDVEDDVKYVTGVILSHLVEDFQ